jgi:hypothetical protein
MKPLQRYEIDELGCDIPVSDGDLVKWEDVEKLFKRIKIHLYNSQFQLEQIRYNANNGFDLIDDLNTKMGWDKLPSPREMYELRKEYEQGEEE